MSISFLSPLWSVLTAYDLGVETDRAKAQAGSAPERKGSAPGAVTPPLTSAEIEVVSPKWERLIEKYQTARAKILGEELIAKDERMNYGFAEEEYTEADLARIGEFNNCRARKALLQELSSLFSQAHYIDANGRLITDDEARQTLLSFLALLGDRLIDDDRVTLYVAICSEDLDPADLEPVVRYLEAQEAGDESTCQTLGDSLIKKVAYLSGRNLETYDGQRDPSDNTYARRADALWWVLSLLLNHDRDVDQMIAARTAPVYQSYLVRDEVGLALYQAAREGDAEARVGLLSYHFYVDTQFYKSPWGSPERIEFFQLSAALYNAALDAGIAYEDLEAFDSLMGLPPSELTDDSQFVRDFNRIQGSLAYICDSPGKVDNAKVKRYYVEKVEGLIQQYLEAENWQERSTLQFVLAAYFKHAQNLGLGLDEVQALVEPLRPMRKSSPFTMETLREREHVVLCPEDLPEEMVDLLKACGEWERVSQLIRITFVHDINDDPFAKSTITGSAGYYAIPKTVVLDTYDEIAGRPRSAVELVLTLLHEGAHNAWYFEHYDEPDLLRQCVTERNSYLRQYLAAEKMLEIPTVLQDEDASFAVALAYVEGRDAVRGANRVIGYRDSDFSQHTTLPDYQERPDLDFYPTLVARDRPVREAQLPNLLRRLGFDERGIGNVADDIGYFLAGSGMLRGEIHYVIGEDEQPTVASFSDLTLISSDDQAIELTDTQRENITYILSALATWCGVDLGATGDFDVRVAKFLSNMHDLSRANLPHQVQALAGSREDLVEGETVVDRYEFGAQEMQYLLKEVRYNLGLIEFIASKQQTQ